jgi:hypothetical protein
MSDILQLREDLRGYHADVKRRLDLAEDQIKTLTVAINGIPGDDTVPGLNVEVQGLRAFRERVRLGVGAAWALILTLITIVWKGR